MVKFLMRLAVLASVVVSLLVLPSCNRSGEGTKTQTRALLLVDCDVSGAEVWINRRFFREASELVQGAWVMPGHYRMEVRHTNYHSSYFEFELSPKEKRTFKISLAKRFAP